MIETIVVVALVAIVGVAVVSIMTPAGNLFGNMQKQAQAKMIASGVMQVIEPQARFGTNLKLVSAKSSDSNRYLYTSGGKVYVVKGETGNKSPVDMFGDDYYNGYTVALTCPRTEGDTVWIRVTVKRSGDEAITSTVETAIQNMNSPSGVTRSGDILCYQWLTKPSQSS